MENGNEKAQMENICKKKSDQARLQKKCGTITSSLFQQTIE
jgi:hypothetical protein